MFQNYWIALADLEMIFLGNISRETIIFCIIFPLFLYSFMQLTIKILLKLILFKSNIYFNLFSRKIIIFCIIFPIFSHFLYIFLQLTIKILLK